MEFLIERSLPRFGFPARGFVFVTDAELHIRLRPLIPGKRGVESLESLLNTIATLLEFAIDGGVVCARGALPASRLFRDPGRFDLPGLSQQHLFEREGLARARPWLRWRRAHGSVPTPIDL